MRTKVPACLLLIAIAQLGALSTSGPRVTFRCIQDTVATSDLILKVRNNGPDRLNAGTTVYYYYRTADSDMSVTGSHRLDGRLDKGGVFTIETDGNKQTGITECGCALRPFVPTARTTRKAAAVY